MEYIVDIPQDCWYWDYQIQEQETGKNKIVAIFEKEDGRVQYKTVGYTDKINGQWRQFDIQEYREGGCRKLKMII